MTSETMMEILQKCCVKNETCEVCPIENSGDYIQNLSYAAWSTLSGGGKTNG